MFTIQPYFYYTDPQSPESICMHFVGSLDSCDNDHDQHKRSSQVRKTFDSIYSWYVMLTYPGGNKSFHRLGTN